MWIGEIEMMKQEEIYDITIIGAGPAGLFGAFYSGLREMKTKIIEYNEILGGKLTTYTEKIIWDIGGITPMPAGKLIEQLSEQARTFQPTIATGEKVISLVKNKEQLFVLTTDKGKKHYSKAVLLATGFGILTPVRLDLPDAEKYEHTNLHYTIQKPYEMKGKRVMISGGGNSAIDWANLLAPIAEKVYLVYRKEELKGHEAEVSRLLASPTIQCCLNTTIEALIGNSEGSKIEAVILKGETENKQVKVQIDELVINHGYKRENPFFENNSVGIHPFKEYYIATNSFGATEVAGIFAAGDSAMYEGKVQLIAGTFQDAVNAVNQAKSYIEPTAGDRGTISSHNEKFEQKNKPLIQKFFVEGKQ